MILKIMKIMMNMAMMRKGDNDIDDDNDVDDDDDVDDKEEGGRGRTGRCSAHRSLATKR